MASDEDVFRGPPWVLDVRWRHSFGALAAVLEGAEGPTPAHELVAHYQNSRSLIIWMNAAIVWMFVGLNCLPGSSFPAAPRGLRITLATVAIATVGTSIAKGAESLIGRRQPQRLVES